MSEYFDHYDKSWDEILRVGEDLDLLLYIKPQLVALRHICRTTNVEKPVRRTLTIKGRWVRKTLTEIPFNTTQPIACGLCSLNGEIKNSQWVPYSPHQAKEEFVKGSVFRIDWDELTEYWQIFHKDPANHSKPLNEQIESFWASRGGRDPYFDYKPAFGYIPRVFLRKDL